MTNAAPQLESTAADAPLSEADLHALMQAVSETTRQLEQTHVALHREVARLKGELADVNAQLRRSESLAALGRMAAGIAHEIRNPLGCIQLYTQALGEDLADQPAQAALCDRISRAVTTLDAIVRDVLLFSREARIEPAPLCARTVMTTALGHCDALLAQADITLDLTRVEPVAFSGDGHLLNQALGNIIRNAIEAMQCTGEELQKLTLAAEVRAMRCPVGAMMNHVVLAVRDTGPGIADDVRERMFNPFFTTRNIGTGLGLAIVHRIVEAHGGQVRVTVHGEQDGGGTTFELCLPPALQPNETHDDGPALIVEMKNQSNEPLSTTDGARMSRAAAMETH